MPQSDNLVHEITTTPGVGNWTVSPLEGKRRFSDNAAWLAGTSFFYFAMSRDTIGRWEYGVGSLVDADTISRDTIIDSSNAGSAVDFAGDEVDVTSDLVRAADLGASNQLDLISGQIRHSLTENIDVSDAQVLDQITDAETYKTYRLVRDTVDNGGNTAFLNVERSVFDQPTIVPTPGPNWPASPGVGQVVTLPDGTQVRCAKVVGGIGYYDPIPAFRIGDVPLGIACSEEQIPIEVTAAATTFRMPKDLPLGEVRASLTNPQVSGSIFTVDITQNGTSIFSTLLTIDNTEKTSTTAATPAVLSATDLFDDDEIVVQVTQIGDGTATGLKVSFIPPEITSASEPLGIAASDEVTPLEVTSSAVAIRMPQTFPLGAVRASLTTPQTSGAILTVDITQNGLSIFSTPITIDNGEKSSLTAATPNVLSASSLGDDDEIIVQVTQVGDGTAAGLKVYLIP
jgi:hypothetical protein